MEDGKEILENAKKKKVVLLSYGDPYIATTHIELRTEKGQRRKVISTNSYAIVASRVGFKDQAIISGKISSLKKRDFGKPPHTVIIPGRLHFTESLFRLLPAIFLQV